MTPTPNETPSVFNDRIDVGGAPGHVENAPSHDENAPSDWVAGCRDELGVGGRVWSCSEELMAIPHHVPPRWG